MAIGRTEALYSILARAWGPYLGEHDAWERAANVAAGLEVAEDLDEVMAYFRQALAKVNWDIQGRFHTHTGARLPWDILERAAWAGILALVSAGYDFPLDGP